MSTEQANTERLMASIQGLTVPSEGDVVDIDHNHLRQSDNPVYDNVDATRSGESTPATTPPPDGRTTFFEAVTTIRPAGTESASGPSSLSTIYAWHRRRARTDALPCSGERFHAGRHFNRK